VTALRLKLPRCTQRAQREKQSRCVWSEASVEAIERSHQHTHHTHKHHRTGHGAATLTPRLTRPDCSKGAAEEAKRRRTEEQAGTGKQ
jgi:hypothetical protein